MNEVETCAKIESLALFIEQHLSATSSDETLQLILNDSIDIMCIMQMSGPRSLTGV